MAGPDDTLNADNIVRLSGFPWGQVLSPDQVVQETINIKSDVEGAIAWSNPAIEALNGWEYKPNSGIKGQQRWILGKVTSLFK